MLAEKLCPDGMGFNDLNHRVEKCDFLYQVDCASRPDLQPPQGSDVCPRANGYYASVEPGKCNEFYFCSEGKGNHLVCPESLVFSLITGTCVWPDEAGRKDEDCKSGNVVNFTCPAVPSHEAVAHPRYADPDDCQYFYVCINGKTPRRNGCNFGMVFNTKLGACDTPTEVPECSEYFFDYFKEYFLNLGDSEVPSPEILQAAVTSGYPVPEVARRVRVRPSGGANVGADGVRKRLPTQEGVDRPQVRAPFDGPQSLAAKEAQELSESKPVENIPGRRRRPALSRPQIRNKPSVRATTTTTTTPAPPIDDYVYPDGDYVYEDYTDAAADAPAPAAETPGGIRFSLRRPSGK